MAKPKRERPTENDFGKRINLVCREKGIPGDYAAVAAYFGVKVPSVYGWIDDGRIAKTKLSKLVEWSGRPLGWWLGNDEATQANTTPQYASEAIVRLQAIGERLTETDWTALIQMALHLSNNKKPMSSDEDLPMQVLPEFEAVLQKQVREAHEHSVPTRKRCRAEKG